MFDVDNTFTYHPPFGTQAERYVGIREEAKKLAQRIERDCPDSREKSLALTDLQRCVQMANAAIAIHEKAPAPPVVVVPPPAPAGLVHQSDLEYLGAFRLPQVPQLQYPGDSLALHDGLLVVQGRAGVHFAFEIPAPVEGPYNSLPVAAIRTVYPSLDDGARLRGNPADTEVRGLLFLPDRLIMTVASFYDATSAQKISHLSRDLATEKMAAYALPPIGHTAGYMTFATGELGPALTGNFGLPILSRESNGPAAFIFDPSDLTKPAVPVLDYPNGATALAPWNIGNDLWTADSRLGGMAMIGRSVLFIGVHGTGPFCYGPPYSGPDAAYVQPPNDPRCDLVLHETTDKGTHTDPYVYRIWAYDANDLVAVKQGKLKPWEPRPYGLWNLTLPYPSGRTRCGGVFDPATSRLYLSQQFSDKDPAQGWPVMHVYQVKVAR